MKKLRWAVCMMAMSSLLGAMGCGSADTKQEAEPAQSTAQSPNEVTEIEFLHPYAGDAVDKLLEAYHQKQNKVRVKSIYVEGSYEGVVEKLQIQAVAKQLPDVSANGFGYTQFAIDSMPIVPLQPIVDKEKTDLSGYFPKFLDLGKGKDGKLYGLPFAVSTPIVYYNANRFKEAGLNPDQPPKTWEELREAAKKLTIDGKYGIFMDYTITNNWLFQAMLETAGGKMLSEDGKAFTFHSSEGKQALQYLADLIHTDKSMPNLTRDQAEQSFLAGNLGIYVASTARLSGLNKQTNFTLRTAVFPTVNNKPRAVPAGGNNLIMLTQNPKKQNAAWDFMKFATSPEGTTLFAQLTGYMVVQKSALERPELMGDYLKKEPNAKVTYDQVDDTVNWYNVPSHAGSKVHKMIQDQIAAALTKQKTVEQALKDASDQANALIK